DDEFDDDFDLGPEEETPPDAAAEGDSRPSDGGEEGDIDFDDDDEDEDGEDSRKPLMIAAAGALVLVVGMFGGAGWWYFSDDQEPTAATAEKSPVRSRDSVKGPRVRIALPPKRGAPNAMLTPPSAGKPGISGPASRPRAKRSEREEPGISGDIGGQFGGQANPMGGSLNALGAIQEEGAGIVVPAVTQLIIRTLPDHPPAKSLGPTPDARLIEKKEGLPGPLPRVGEDGTTPWEAYKRPYVEETPGARVAIVIKGLGLSRAATMATIGKMPPEVTLVLDPYARDLGDWLVRARLVGHEVMLALPMESERFPVHDAGPYSLDTGLKLEDNMKRLELLLSQFSGYFGVATVMGSRFGTSEEFLTPVLQVLKDRGLLFLATGAQADLLAPKIASTIGLPRVISDMTLDDDPSGAAIEAKLARLEEIVLEKKSAVAVAHPYPSTLARLIVWTKKLKEKKINLVPLSALVKTWVQEKPDNQ
ncbi:MAG: divergent polysaccharide deacetylase family protein, partial [Rhodospirillales bacterium]